MTSGVPLTKEQEKFLAELEEEFKDRYTEKDEEFKATFTEKLSTPPVVEDWVRLDQTRNWDSGYSRDESRRYGRYREGRQERSSYSQNQTPHHHSRTNYRNRFP